MILPIVIAVAAVALYAAWRTSPAQKAKALADQVRESGGATATPPMPAPGDIVGGINHAFTDPGPAQEARASLVSRDVENTILAEIARGEWTLSEAQYGSDRFRNGDLIGAVAGAPTKVRYLTHRARYRALTPPAQLAMRLARASDIDVPRGLALPFGAMNPDAWLNQPSIPIDVATNYDAGDALSFTDDVHYRIETIGIDYANAPSTARLLAAFFAKYPAHALAPRAPVPVGGPIVNVGYTSRGGAIRYPISDAADGTDTARRNAEAAADGTLYVQPGTSTAVVGRPL